jgi:hypothetical protein
MVPEQTMRAMRSVVSPLLSLENTDERSVWNAITEVADRLAMAGALITDPSGAAIPGVRDEEAAFSALGRYGMLLIEAGRTIESERVHDLMALVVVVTKLDVR